MAAVGGEAPFTVTDPNTGEVAGGQLEGACTQHRLLPVQRRRGAVHPQLRPPVLADVALGSRRRWPDEHPADRQPDRLPALASRSPVRTAPRARIRSPASRATCRPRSRTTSRRPPTRRSRTARPPRYGEALFNLSLASGAYSCARCHTLGWSYDKPTTSGQGAYGWNLTGGSTNNHFATEADMVAFIKSGSEEGKLYGRNGQGTRPHAGIRHRCSPTSRSKPSSNTYGACDVDVGDCLGTRDPRSCSPSSSRVVVLCGSIYLIMATNMGARLAFLVALAGAVRLAVAHGHHVVDLRHRPEGPRPDVGGGAGQDGAPGHAGPLHRRCPGDVARRPRRRHVPGGGRARRRATPRRRAGTSSTPRRQSSARCRRRPACSSRRRERSPPASSRSSRCSTSVAIAIRRSTSRSTSSPSSTSRTTCSPRPRRSSRCAPSRAGRRFRRRSTTTRNASTST